MFFFIYLLFILYFPYLFISNESVAHKEYSCTPVIDSNTLMPYVLLYELLTACKINDYKFRIYRSRSFIHWTSSVHAVLKI